MANQPIDLLMQPKWRVIDQSSLGPLFDAKQSFAMDDTLCMSAGIAYDHTVSFILQQGDAILQKREACILYSKDNCIVVHP